jgi:hypothetical protein
MTKSNLGECPRKNSGVEKEKFVKAMKITTRIKKIFILQEFIMLQITISHFTTCGALGSKWKLNN